MTGELAAKRMRDDKRADAVSRIADDVVDRVGNQIHPLVQRMIITVAEAEKIEELKDLEKSNDAERADSSSD